MHKCVGTHVKPDDRKAALVTEELHRFEIDTAVLSETWLSMEYQLSKIERGNGFFWVGNLIDEKQKNGVSFMIRKKPS